MQRWLKRAVLVILLGVAALASYRWARSQVAAAVYRDRLATLADEYLQLRNLYNEAVRRTAVTELEVRDDRLLVVVRTAAGALREIETGVDPAREVYVDYVVVDGRLWIRRVFDAAMPPRDGVVIDPDLAAVDWTAPNVEVGKAVYRRLKPGRWIVTVTGNGALGLVQQDPKQAAPVLVPPPPIRAYPLLQQDIDTEIARIGLRDVLNVVWTRLSGRRP